MGGWRFGQVARLSGRQALSISKVRMQERTNELAGRGLGSQTCAPGNEWIRDTCSTKFKQGQGGGGSGSVSGGSTGRALWGGRSKHCKGITDRAVVRWYPCKQQRRPRQRKQMSSHSDREVKAGRQCPEMQNTTLVQTNPGKRAGSAPQRRPTTIGSRDPLDIRCDAQSVARTLSE